jgi:hypothetical protein
VRVTGATLPVAGIAGILCFPLPKKHSCRGLRCMLVPFLRAPVLLKGRPEMFLVVASNLTDQTADLILPGTEIIERGVPWSILEAARKARLNLRLSA